MEPGAYLDPRSFRDTGPVLNSNSSSLLSTVTPSPDRFLGKPLWVETELSVLPDLTTSFSGEGGSGKPERNPFLYYDASLFFLRVSGFRV